MPHATLRSIRKSTTKSSTQSVTKTPRSGAFPSENRHKFFWGNFGVQTSNTQKYGLKHGFYGTKWRFRLTFFNAKAGSTPVDRTSSSKSEPNPRNE